jgi:phosphoglycolate phosphatase
LYAIEKLGLQEPEPVMIQTFIGSSLHLYFVERHNLAGKAVEDGVRYYREYFSAKGLYENRLYPGIDDLVRRLFEKNIGIYLVTSKPTVYAKQILVHFGLDKYFKDIYGSELTVQNTSKELLIANCIKGEGLKTESSLMIGDRMHDVNGARANSVYSAAVTYGYGTIEELRNCSPDYLINSVDELYEVIGVFKTG